MEELEEIEDDGGKGEVIQNSSLIGFVHFMINNLIPQQNNTAKVLGDDP
jgi:hypothetical protein